MKKILRVMLGVVVLTVSLVACRPSAVVVRARPPAPIYVRPAPPRTNYIWIEGGYARVGRSYAYRPGYWIAPRNNRIYQQGYWKQTNRGYVWVPGSW